MNPSTIDGAHQLLKAKQIFFIKHGSSISLSLAVFDLIDHVILLLSLARAGKEIRLSKFEQLFIFNQLLRLD